MTMTGGYIETFTHSHGTGVGRRETHLHRRALPAGNVREGFGSVLLVEPTAERRQDQRQAEDYARRDDDLSHFTSLTQRGCGL